MLPAWTHEPIRALAGALFDRGAGVPDERVTWTIADLGEHLRLSGPRIRLGFLAALYLLDRAAPLFGFPERMSKLPVEARVRYLERLEGSVAVPLLLLPKIMVCFIYYEHPEALAETGFDGEPLVKLGKKSAA